MHEDNKKSFLGELQSLDEATKRKVAIVATVIIMVGVIFVWVGYFNGLVAGVSQQQTTVATNNSPSFTQNIKSGMAAIGNGFVGATQWFIGIFKNPGQYTIHP